MQVRQGHSGGCPGQKGAWRRCWPAPSPGQPGTVPPLPIRGHWGPQTRSCWASSSQSPEWLPGALTPSPWPGGPGTLWVLGGVPPGSVEPLKEALELGCIPARGSGPLGAVCSPGDSRAWWAPQAGRVGARTAPGRGREAAARAAARGPAGGSPGRGWPGAQQARGPAPGPGVRHCCYPQGWGPTPARPWLLQASAHRKRVEHIAKRKLESLIKESKIRDCEDPNDFTVSTLGRPGGRAEGKTVSSMGPGATGGRGGSRACLCTPVHACAHVHLCVQTCTRTRAHTHTCTQSCMGPTALSHPGGIAGRRCALCVAGHRSLSPGGVRSTPHPWVL